MKKIDETIDAHGAWPMNPGEDISNCRFQILLDGVEKSMNISKDFP